MVGFLSFCVVAEIFTAIDLAIDNSNKGIDSFEVYDICKLWKKKFEKIKIYYILIIHFNLFLFWN